MFDYGDQNQLFMQTIFFKNGMDFKAIMARNLKR